METEEIFKECMKDYPLDPTSLAVNPILIQAPLPGGATATTINQLKDMGMVDKFPALVKSMKECVERGGFATSVTPVSQFYAQQAFLNATQGDWKVANPGYAKMLLGYFGKTPCEPDPELVKWAEEKMNMAPTTEKVVDLNDKDPEKGLKAAEERLKAAGLPVTDENLFIAAACKDGNVDKGIDFLLGKGTVSVNKSAAKKAEAPSVSSDSNAYTVTVNGKKYAVAFEGEKATVNGKLFDFSVKEGIEAKAAASGEGTPIKAALPGNVLKVLVSEGDTIAEGDVIAVVEAMKMETEIKSPVSGTVNSVEIEVGNKVQAGQVLVTVG
jgi:pyruvate carboxylase subunit B